MKCDKCGAELKSGAKFCTVCGEKVEVQRACPNCGKPIKEGVKFCRECGAAVNTAENPIPQAQPTPIKTEQVRYAAPAPVKTGKNKTAIGIIAAVVAVVVVIGIAGAAMLVKKHAPLEKVEEKVSVTADTEAEEIPKRKIGDSEYFLDSAVFIKNGCLYLAYGDEQPILLTDKLFSDAFCGLYDRGYFDDNSWQEIYNGYRYISFDYTDEDNYWVEDSVKSLCRLCRSGNVLYYPSAVVYEINHYEDIDQGTSTDEYHGVKSFELYSLDLLNITAEPVRIAADIKDYSSDESGSEVIYISHDNAVNLYTADDGKTEYLGDYGDDEYGTRTSAWADFYEGGDIVTYVNGDRKLCIKQKGKETEVTECTRHTDDFSNNHTKVYYTNRGGFYCYTLGEGEKLIDSDAPYFSYKVYETGEVFYIKQSERGIDKSLEDMLYDDMYKSDMQKMEEYGEGYYMYEPERSDYASEEDFEQAESEYQEFEKYYMRQSLRDLIQYTQRLYEGSLYYYDGTESVLVSHSVRENFRFSEFEPAVYYSAYSDDFEGKGCLSDVARFTYKPSPESGEIAIEEKVMHVFCDEYYFCAGVNYKVDMTGIPSVMLLDDGKTVAYTHHDEFHQPYDLMIADISGGEIANPRKIGIIDEEELYNLQNYISCPAEGYIVYENSVYSNSTESTDFISDYEKLIICGDSLIIENDGELYLLSGGTGKLLASDVTETSEDMYETGFEPHETGKFTYTSAGEKYIFINNRAQKFAELDYDEESGSIYVSKSGSMGLAAEEVEIFINV